jgi:hypothetical protein
MKKRISLSIVLVFALSSFVAPMSAGAASKLQVQYESQYVYADFVEWSDDWCSGSGIFIGAGQTQVKEQSKGRPLADSWSSMWIEIVQWDWCDEESWGYTGVSGYAELPASSLNIDKKLSQATLFATGVVFVGYAYDDWESGEITFVVDLDLVWIATEPATSGRSSSTWRGPDFMNKDRSRGISRWAEASGDVVVDGNNVTPYPSTWAGIGKSSGSWMEISR